MEANFKTIPQMIREYMAKNGNFDEDDLEEIVSDEFLFALFNTKDIRNEMINNVTTRGKFTGVDDFIPPYQTSQWISIKQLETPMALGKVDGELTFTKGDFGQGLSKRFGTPTHFIWFTDGGESGEWEIDKDCVVFPANSTCYPEIRTINRYADMLNAIDISIKALLIYSRDIPIPLCLDDNQKRAIEQAIKDIRCGKFTAVQTFDLEAVKTLDITRPEMIQYMSNYSLLYDEMLKRFYLHFGIVIDSKDKKAQLTTKELDTNSQVAGAAYYQHYDLQKKQCERANELFGCNIDYIPGDYLDDLSNGKNDEFESPEEEEIVEETTEEVQEEQNND